MKCPKCGYLGFERVERCRNCGYDFSLTAAAVLPELSLRLDNSMAGPLDDLALIDASTPAPLTQAMSDARPDLDRMIGLPAVAPPPDRGDELPLFGAVEPDDAPLITRPSAPRQPLAVRRSTPEPPRLRTEQPRIPSLDLGTDDGAPRPSLPRGGSQTKVRHLDRSSEAAGEAAGMGARFLSVAIDLTILAAIDAAVVYFTLQICGVTVEEFGILPKGPLIAFLLVQNVGYLVAFTAGGQTLGKMATGIRVVAADGGSSLDLGHAFLRELMWLALAIPAGLGFLPTLFSRDRRGLHDRFAGTRVVR
jgi:uncharacterized RDD family membrane protein YckC